MINFKELIDNKGDDSLELHAKILTYGGIIPFAATAIASLGAYDFIFEFKIYAALIIAFLGGINWAFGMKQRNKNILYFSVLPSIAVWFLVIIPYDVVSLCLIAVLFLWQLFFDYSLYKADIYQRCFFKLRRNATFAVIASIILAVFAAL